MPLLASTDAIRLVTNPNLTASAIASSEVGCCLIQSHCGVVTLIMAPSKVCSMVTVVPSS
jgi:hypothetical protein